MSGLSQHRRRRRGGGSRTGRQCAELVGIAGRASAQLGAGGGLFAARCQYRYSRDQSPSRSRWPEHSLGGAGGVAFLDGGGGEARSRKAPLTRAPLSIWSAARTRRFGCFFSPPTLRSAWKGGREAPRPTKTIESGEPSPHSK